MVGGARTCAGQCTGVVVTWPPGQSVISVKHTVRDASASAAVMAAAREAVLPPATTISQLTSRASSPSATPQVASATTAIRNTDITEPLLPILLLPLCAIMVQICTQLAVSAIFDLIPIAV